MDIMPITLENGRLVVNTARQIKRDKWDPSQAFRV